MLLNLLSVVDQKGAATLRRQIKSYMIVEFSARMCCVMGVFGAYRRIFRVWRSVCRRRMFRFATHPSLETFLYVIGRVGGVMIIVEAWNVRRRVDYEGYADLWN